MHVAQLYRYPVKGLSAEPLGCVQLEASGIFPFDRCLAFLRTQSDFDGSAPRWLPKANFLMLMLHERLAELRTRFDPERRLLIIESSAGMHRFAIDDPEAKRELEAFLERAAGDRAGTPRLVEAPAHHFMDPAHHFMDKADNVISLINLASIDDLASRLQQPVDPLRFRANIYISGAPAWDELDWVGRELRIGSTLLRVDRRNGRCAATNVNPSSAPPAAASAATAPTAAETWICRACYLVVPAARVAPLPADWECPDCGADAALLEPQFGSTGG